MCTLSIFTRIGEQCIITMNRDEARNRPESNHIQHQSNGLVDWYYPVDKRSLGTWFGFNNCGVIFALLNRYHEQQFTSAPSRGAIIPTLLEFDSLHDCQSTLSKILTQRYNPFDLLGIDQQNIIKYSWNGQKLHQNSFKHPQSLMFSSSSVDTTHVLNKRAMYFENFKTGLHTTHDKPLHLLNQLHKQQDQDLSSSIFMSRPETHTKSISQVVINNNMQQLDYFYFDELQLDKQKQIINHEQCQHKTLKIKF